MSSSFNIDSIIDKLEQNTAPAGGVFLQKQQSWFGYNFLGQ